jgi:hypothetical protein
MKTWHLATLLFILLQYQKRWENDTYHDYLHRNNRFF